MPKSLILKQLCEQLELSISAFERVINVSNGVIVKSIERDADISPLIKSKISKKYPNVNPVWLETGEGDIFIKGYDINTAAKQVITVGKTVPTRLTAEQYAEAYGDWLGVPMYNVPITASFVENYHDSPIYKPQYYLHDPRFKDCAFGAFITGDSMHGEIRHGDFVACREIVDRRFIVYGDIYYIVTDELETCKYINADPANPDNYLLVPHNKSISPSPIPKELIKRLYKVRGVVRGY